MGAAASIDLRPEEIDELTTLTKYEPKEVRTLYKRFRRLDRTGKGTISIDDLLMIPEVVMNPLAARLVQLFDKDEGDRINFRAFVTGLAVFNEKSPKEIRARSLFRVFDCDGDGFISGKDLGCILSMMAGKSLSQSAVDAITAATFEQADMDGDGKLSFDDFETSMSVFQWDSFTVPVKKTSREQYFLQLDEQSQTRAISSTNLPGLEGNNTGGGGGGGGGGGE